MTVTCRFTSVPIFVCLALGGAATAAGQSQCNDTSWLNPPDAPPFLFEVSQAATGPGDCQFHEFASQNFLALVLDGAQGLESWPISNQVLPPTGASDCATSTPLGSSLSHLLNKVPFGSVLQASGQPAVDQNGRYLQYEIRMNPTLCNAIKGCQLYTSICAQAAGNDNFTFYAGSSSSSGIAEVKIAWRVLETCNLPDSPNPCQRDDLSEFFTITGASVSSYSPRHLGSQSGLTMGLVGFHLIQKTPEHPEQIWATWEHISNDPPCPGSDNSVCEDPSQPSGVYPTGWSLYNPSIKQSPQCPADPVKNQDPSTPNCINTSYYESTRPQDQPKSQICRLFPCGCGDVSGLECSSSENTVSNIQELNDAIRTKLEGNVWWNYFLVGSVWGQNANPTGPSSSAGSLFLANTTMESFYQTTQQQLNCFSCHGSVYVISPKDGQVPLQFLQLDFTHSLTGILQQGGPACEVSFPSCDPSQ